MSKSKFVLHVGCIKTLNILNENIGLCRYHEQDLDEDLSGQEAKIIGQNFNLVETGL